MSHRIRGIDDVAALQLCCGCGACAYLSPDEIEMVDVLDHGRRPRFRNGAPADPRSLEALEACPGIRLDAAALPHGPPALRDLAPGWGPVLEIWEGFACDQEVRFRGSSGGVATALGLSCLEDREYSGVLHVGPRTDVPYLNGTRSSRSRADLLEGSGSRYAPASPCDGLRLVEEAAGPSALIGKPCDAAAAWSARRKRPDLDRRLGLTVAIFCAGAPSTRGTLDLFRALGIDDPGRVLGVRYRGEGWPGKAAVRLRSGAAVETREMSYEESWGEILQKHRPWRCHICPDHTGEFADVSVGDPWYRPIEPGEPGTSLVVVRTERGREAVREAQARGRLNLLPAPPSVLPASQRNLLKARAATWGRLLALRLLGVPIPSYRGLPLARLWLSELTVREKISSLYGTAKRAIGRRLRRRRPMEPFSPGDV